MFRYQVYGLCVGANRPIPGLRSASLSTPVDLHVDLRGAEPFPESLTPIALLYSGSDIDTKDAPIVTMWQLEDAEASRYFRLRLARGGEFLEFTLNAKATRVWATWTEGVRFESVAALFPGQLLAAILWLRGITCLHASVVAVDGRAVALVGSPGAGKSSTAAVFAQRGHAVLADDVAALDDLGTRFLIQPAYPALALWRDTAATLLGSTDLPRIWRTIEKHSLELHAESESTSFRFEAQPLLLAAIYFLGPRRVTNSAPLILRITPASGLLILIANTYTRAHPNEEHRVREFKRLSRVARHVPLRQIDRPNDLASLPHVCDAIVDDVARIGETRIASFA